jgi:hypothetical protein
MESWKDKAFRYACIVVPLLFAALVALAFIYLPDALQLPFALVLLVMVLGLNRLQKYYERRIFLFSELLSAIRSGSPEELAALLRLGVPSRPLPKSEMLVWLLKGAVLRRSTEMIRIVLKAGANWDEKDSSGTSSREYAERLGVDISE